MKLKINFISLSKIALCAILLVAFCPNSKASFTTVAFDTTGDGVDGAIFANFGTHFNTANVDVGNNLGGELRAYLGFDLEALDVNSQPFGMPKITNGTLSLEITNFTSDSATNLTNFNLEIFSYPDAGPHTVNSLRTFPGSGPPFDSAFIDLGDGNSYGSQILTITPADIGSTIDIPLNTLAFNAMTAAAQSTGDNAVFVMGLRGTPTGGGNQFVQFAGNSTLSVTTIPEPGSWAVIGSVMCGVAWISRRRRKTGAAEIA